MWTLNLAPCHIVQWSLVFHSKRTLVGVCLAFSSLLFVVNFSPTRSHAKPWHDVDPRLNFSFSLTQSKVLMKLSPMDCVKQAMPSAIGWTLQAAGAPWVPPCVDETWMRLRRAFEAVNREQAATVNLIKCEQEWGPPSNLNHWTCRLGQHTVITSCAMLIWSEPKGDSFWVEIKCACSSWGHVAVCLSKPLDLDLCGAPTDL